MHSPPIQNKFNDFLVKLEQKYYSLFVQFKLSHSHVFGNNLLIFFISYLQNRQVTTKNVVNYSDRLFTSL